MKKILTHRWLRCTIVFLIILILRIAWCRLVPSDDPEGSNLLVNVVAALIPTAVYAVLDRWLLDKFWKRQLDKRIS